MPPLKKKSGVTILIQSSFQTKLVRKDKEGHFIVITRKLHQEEIKIVNFCVPSVGVLKFTKHTILDLKTQVDPTQ
jgi:hypothetical protein